MAHIRATKPRRALRANSCAGRSRLFGAAGGAFFEKETSKMAAFDELIKDIGSQYSLGPNAGALVQEIAGLISGQPGGIAGFRDRFKAAGFTAEVASWSGGAEVVPLSGEEVEQ